MYYSSTSVLLGRRVGNQIVFLSLPSWLQRPVVEGVVLRLLAGGAQVQRGTQGRGEGGVA